MAKSYPTGHRHPTTHGGRHAHESTHDRIIKGLDDNDHLTKRGGGEATHGSETTLKSRELGERSRSGKTGEREPIGPKGASNYGSGAHGAHGARK
jgi:hypothetical protein